VLVLVLPGRQRSPPNDGGGRKTRVVGDRSAWLVVASSSREERDRSHEHEHEHVHVHEHVHATRETR